ncbi:hypothetical protein WOLCODRAFT_69898 [Wolfiporia cocos MD-104 SS10]|uniref:DUF676 domain-containing protein n=1 Tax=Wolfiporia cocos (strain MD-104) TaxID=742152 RepID=A0A2H3JI11_WOLCO|nr:hypothetical protein WOLCODRAFT_69898 [Wolfiporia cocos MD-104 SS10]
MAQSSEHDTPGGPHAESRSPPADLILVIFIHGFKGTDTTFGGFPERIQYILSESIDNVLVESIVFPAYETKGELSEAVIRFADWLTSLTVEREVARGLGGGAGKAKIILCGHSMGGLLAADALIEFVRTRPDQGAPLWPNIIGCLAFDTPYLGLHPHVFRNSATQATSYAQNVLSSFQSFTKQTSAASNSSRASIAAPASASRSTAASASAWQKWAPAAYAVGGALIAGAAAGAAYYRREELSVSYKWASDHMKYVGTLWDEGKLHKRLEELLAIEEQMGVIFRTFYTFLPPAPPSHPSPRTFIVLPKTPQLAQHFIQAPNELATDEVHAHTGMFDIKTNDGYYEIGLTTAQLIREVVSTSRTQPVEQA